MCGSSHFLLFSRLCWLFEALCIRICLTISAKESWLRLGRDWAESEDRLGEGVRAVFGCFVVSDSAALWTVPRPALCPWDSAGKNTGVVAMPSSRGSSQPRGRTWVSCTAGGFFTHRATCEELLPSKQYSSSRTHPWILWQPWTLKTCLQREPAYLAMVRQGDSDMSSQSTGQWISWVGAISVHTLFWAAYICRMEQDLRKSR